MYAVGVDEFFSTKFILSFLIELTTKDEWELTDVREYQGFTSDYEKQFFQTLPGKVS